MKFERILMIWDIYDGPRSGLAMYEGLPHYFACPSGQAFGGFSDSFQLSPVNDEFVRVAQEQWKIFREWESKYHRGLASLESHPGRRGVNPKYDEYDDWLRDAVEKLKPSTGKFLPRFEELPGQDDLPPGILRELGAAWIRISQ